MTTIQSKHEIITALQEISQQVTDSVASLSDEHFNYSVDENWSAAGYLKHLILSVKPFARAIQLPKAVMGERFGTRSDGSLTYDELVTQYDEKIAAGMRAENAPNSVPVNYKFPDDVADDIQAYLIETWQQANQQLIDTLSTWSEDELDTYCLPHPALASITIREMCFFTIHHNQVHCADIQNAPHQS